MTDYRAVAVENARQEFAPPTFREPEPCDVCGARIQLHERDGLMYDAEHTEADPELHTCGPKLTVRPGRFDQAERKQSLRKQRERGCSIYITAEQLAQCGIDPEGPAPMYRIWAATQRPRVVVNLYPADEV